MDLRLIIAADRGIVEELCAQILARLERAEQSLIVDFIVELTGGDYTFSQARAVWKRGWSDLYWSDWNDPEGLLRFLLAVRHAIDPHARHIFAPRFRPEPS